ncbi:MAG: tetratricopeptide repeat protein [Myxococcota bacterium]
MADDDLEITLASNYLMHGAAANAIEVLKRLLSREPEHAVAHSLLAQALLKQRRLHAALHEAELGLSLEPENALCHRVMAGVYVGHNQIAKAREHARQALELSPQDASTNIQLSAIELLDDQTARALEYANAARSLAPDDPDAISSVAQAELGAGNLAAAEAAAHDALELDPEHADSLVTMGELLLRRGDVSGAREHAVAVLYTAPDHDGALRLLVAIKTRQNWFLGLWWRTNAWLTLRPGRAIFVLVLAYLLQRLLVTWTRIEGHRMTSEIVALGWLGLCIYSWVAPGFYRRALEKELEVVKLRADF